MFNFSILILVFLFLISKNIFLLNEETLILFCFVIFCWVIFDRLNELIDKSFLDRSIKIEQSFVNSLNQVENSLVVNANLQRKFWSLESNFEVLKNHFVKLNGVISNKLSTYLIQHSQTAYLNKLAFTQRLEQQTAKLLALLLSKKLYKIVSLRQFYTQKLKLSNFLCFYKISLREYFEII